MAGKFLHYCRVRGWVFTTLLMVCLGMVAGCRARHGFVAPPRPMERRERPSTRVYEGTAVHKLRIQLLAGQSCLNLQSNASLVLDSGGKSIKLREGLLSLELVSATPPVNGAACLLRLSSLGKHQRSRPV